MIDQARVFSSLIAKKRPSCHLATVIATLGLAATPLWGATVYDAGGASDHLILTTESDSPERPYGAQLGNTVTLEGKERYLTSITVTLGTDNPDAPQNVRVTVYQNDGREDPGKSGLAQPGTIIASASLEGVILQKGLDSVKFAFDDVFVPDSFTFVVDFSLGGEKSGTGGILASNGEGKIGFGLDTLWYGDGKPENWQTDSRYALAAGAKSNLFAAQIEASDRPLTSVPETAPTLLLGLSLAILIPTLRFRPHPESGKNSPSYPHRF